MNNQKRHLQTERHLEWTLVYASVEEGSMLSNAVELYRDGERMMRIRSPDAGVRPEQALESLRAEAHKWIADYQGRHHSGDTNFAEMVRLLVIDDEAALTRTLKLNLEDTGRYEVHTLNDPRMAVQTALRVRPDLILLDLMMPEMDGDDVAQALRQHSELKAIPVVFLTALIAKEQQEDVLAANPIRYGIAKPARLAEIDAVVAKLVPRDPFR